MKVAEAAAEAFKTYGGLAGGERAAFLRSCAEALEAVGGALVSAAMRESHLPEARLKGELGRTTGQLRFFAAMVETDDWADPRIDVADPERAPLPKPDVRSMLRPIGPVAVFGAANFPLAFSVAGGDTASALAAGCTVVAKVHPAQPETCAIAGEALRSAVARCGLPEGVFALIGPKEEPARELVAHPAIAAVGFTGSRRGGQALIALAAARPRPIPVFAEMSSVNPVVILPGALTEATAKGLAASVTLGAGQFCTNPGLVFTVGPAEPFNASVADALKAVPAQPMLHTGIEQAYRAACEALSTHPAVTCLVAHDGPGSPVLFQTDASAFRTCTALQAECFGPSTLVVRCADRQELLAALATLEGQLTASLHGTAEELASAGDLVAALERIAGRLIANGWPTGVEVCSAMVHGGPFPATSDGRSTSVGGRAILRWVRPVAYQGFPTDLLPAALR